jgi:hypothetical protein
MGDIFVVGAEEGRARRLDLLAEEQAGGGWCNVLPGYHEVRVHGDGAWHVAGFVLAADGAAALQLVDGRLIDAHEHPDVVRLRTVRRVTALADVLARDVGRARAWQAATSAIDRPLDAGVLGAANAVQLALTT